MFHIDTSDSLGVSSVIGVAVLVAMTIVVASVVFLSVNSFVNPINAYAMDSHVEVSDVTEDKTVTVEYASSVGFDNLKVYSDTDSYTLDSVNDEVTLDVKEGDTLTVRGTTESGVSEVVEIITITDVPDTTDDTTDASDDTSHNTDPAHTTCKHKHNGNGHKNGKGHQDGHKGHEKGQGHQKHC